MGNVSFTRLLYLRDKTGFLERGIKATNVSRFGAQTDGFKLLALPIKALPTVIGQIPVRTTYLFQPSFFSSVDPHCTSVLDPRGPKVSSVS